MGSVPPLTLWPLFLALRLGVSLPHDCMDGRFPGWSSSSSSSWHLDPLLPLVCRCPPPHPAVMGCLQTVLALPHGGGGLLTNRSCVSPWSGWYHLQHRVRRTDPGIPCVPLRACRGRRRQVCGLHARTGQRVTPGTTALSGSGDLRERPRPLGGTVGPSDPAGGGAFPPTSNRGTPSVGVLPTPTRGPGDVGSA